MSSPVDTRAREQREPADVPPSGGSGPGDEGEPGDRAPDRSPQRIPSRAHLDVCAEHGPMARPTPAERRRYRRFAWGFLLLSALLIGAVAGYNAWVDPLNTLGTGKHQAGTNTLDRAWKQDLIDELDAAPDVLVLGSSRTMKMNPADIEELSGASAFNAAVSGGGPLDAYVFASHFAERFDGDFPHLVWGVDVESLRQRDMEPVMMRDGRFREHVPLDEQVTGVGLMVKPLFSIDTAKLSLRLELECDGASGALRRNLCALLGHEQGRARGQRVEPFTRDDFRADGYFTWGYNQNASSAPLEVQIRRQMSIFVGAVYRDNGFDSLDEQAQRRIERTLALANEHGDTPTLYLTPFHPDAAAMLEDYDGDERHAEVLEWFESIEDEYDFTLVDLTDIESFGGSPTEFYDGIHMRPANQRAVAEELASRDLL